jgi:hypothetical protein
MITWFKSVEEKSHNGENYITRNYVYIILSGGRVTVGGVWIGNWIY